MKLSGAMHNPEFIEGRYIVGTSAPMLEGYNTSEMAWRSQHNTGDNMTRTIKPITMKSAAWGIIPHEREGHFQTGWVGYEPEMQIGQNVIITDALQVEKMRRGRSAAVFTGHFSGAMSIAYQMGMESMLHIIQNLQTGRLTIDPTGYIVGDWTFKKQGDNILLHPVT